MASRSDSIFIGIKGTVLAIARETGDTLWRTELKGSDFVNVSLDAGDLFAASKGRLYRLDPATGEIRWCNELPGLGWGLVTMAGTPQAVAVSAEKQRRDAQAAAAAASA
jgi:outer membrane protein assembly factor BamB